MEESGAAVVPQSRPEREHVGLVGPGEGVDGWKAVDKLLEPFDHARGLGLLEHQLADKNAVGVSRRAERAVSPGQVAGVGPGPAKQRADERAVAVGGGRAGAG